MSASSAAVSGAAVSSREPAQAKEETAAPAAARMSSGVLILLTGTALLVSFSESMLIPALPTIQNQYNASAAAVSWVPAIYLLVGAVSLPLVGKFGDIYGKKRMLIFVMIAYSAAVVLDGFAWDLSSLLAFRAIQGLGLSMFPLAISMIQDEMPAERVPVSVGLISAMNGVGAAIGLLGGAYITQSYGWQANYHLLAPFSVLLTFLLWWRAIEAPHQAGERIDYRGIALLGLTVAFLLVAISEGGVLGWTAPGTLALFALGAVFGVALTLLERAEKDPLFAIRRPEFGSLMKVNVAMLLAGAIMFVGFYIVIYVAQEPYVGLGRDVSSATLILAPAAILMLVFAPLGGRLSQRIGPKTVELAGFAMGAVSFVLFLLFHATGPQLGVAAVILLGGVGFLLTALSVSILLLASRDKVGTEVSLNTSFRTIGQAVGVAISGAFLATFLVPGTVLPSDQAYGDASLVGLAMSVIGLLVVLTLPRLRTAGKVVAAG